MKFAKSRSLLKSLSMRMLYCLLLWLALLLHDPWSNTFVVQGRLSVVGVPQVPGNACAAVCNTLRNIVLEMGYLVRSPVTSGLLGCAPCAKATKAGSS